MKQKTEDFLSNLFFGSLAGFLFLAGAAAYFGAWSGDPAMAPKNKKPLVRPVPTAKVSPSPRPTATATPRPKATPGATPVVVSAEAKPTRRVFQPTPWPTMELSPAEKRALAERAKRFKEGRGVDPP